MVQDYRICPRCGEEMEESHTQYVEGYEMQCPQCGYAKHIDCNNEDIDE